MRRRIRQWLPWLLLGLPLLLIVVGSTDSARTTEPQRRQYAPDTESPGVGEAEPGNRAAPFVRLCSEMLFPLAVGIRWEWFKLSHRWLPWILLVVLLLLTQLGVWANAFSYTDLRRTSATTSVPFGAADGSQTSLQCRDVLAEDATRLPNVDADSLPGLQAECRELQAGQDRRLAGSYDALTLPGSIVPALNLGVSVAIIALAILTASHIGSEYAWNTVRPNLVRGRGRWQLATSQLVLIALIAGAALMAVVAATAVSSTIARHVVPPPSHVAVTSTWKQDVSLLGRGWLALTAYVAVAGFFTQLSRSAAVGMAVTIGYHLGEQVIVATLSGPVGWFHLVARYLLAQNVAALVGLSAFGQGQTVLSRTHALLVVIAYTLVLATAALSVFQVRDVSGTSGG